MQQNKVIKIEVLKLTTSLGDLTVEEIQNDASWRASTELKLGDTAIAYSYVTVKNPASWALGKLKALAKRRKARADYLRIELANHEAAHIKYNTLAKELYKQREG